MALELEELRREQAGYEQQVQAVDEAMKAIQEQIDSMACTVSQNKVRLNVKSHSGQHNQLLLLLLHDCVIPLLSLLLFILCN